MTAAPPLRRRGGRPLRLFASLAGYAAGDLRRDLAAGLTLAAIAIPEQMATARLGGFTPEAGFLAFVAGALAFSVFGASRFLSVGADSTITPIFAGALAALAAGGTAGGAAYDGAAAALALTVGVILVAGGLFRLGWIADLLSLPVTTGFLAGISVHIVVSQLPALLGLPAPGGPLLHQLAAIILDLGRTNPYCLAIGLGVLGVILVSERISSRIPGALLGLMAAIAAVVAFGLEARGVAVLTGLAAAPAHLSLPQVGVEQVIRAVPLALVVAMVVMLQTAATTRSFVAPDEEPDLDRDFLGVGAGCILSGLMGSFPVNSSPPRTAIVAETGGRSQIAGLLAAGLAVGLIAFGSRLLLYVPHAALAGVLLFIGGRIFRVRRMAAIYRRTPAEFALVVATLAAIVVLPIDDGVGIGMVLSLLHGVWTSNRATAIEFERVAGTSIWWAPRAGAAGERVPGIMVVAFQAPLSFLNAYAFRRALQEAIDDRAKPPRLVILEAGSIATIDYTAAQALADLIGHCHAAGIDFAVARLESLRAQAAFAAFGLTDLLGADHLFHSVDEAIRALAPEPA